MLTIVVEAGGESHRMGTNKALRPFRGVPLIQRVLLRISPLANELLVVANNPTDFAFLGCPVISDLIPGKGSLGGLYTALSAARYPFVAVIACDLPFASAELIRLELELADREEMDVVLPISERGAEPLHAVYRKDTCVLSVYRSIQMDQLRMTSWMGEVKVRKLESQELSVWNIDQKAFLNVNTPEEFTAAESLED